MKIRFTIFCCFFAGALLAQQTNQFDIFSYTVPAGFTLKEQKEKLFFQKNEGKDYCQLVLYPAVASQGDAEKDFRYYWDFFARNAAQGVNEPDEIVKDSTDGWALHFGAAEGKYNKQPFAITVSTMYKDEMVYCIATVFTKKEYMQLVEDFIRGVLPDEKKFVRTSTKQPLENSNVVTNTNSSSNTGISKYTTNFDDGWIASPTEDFVKLSKAGTELHLHYIDKALDDARPNTIDAPEYYWSKYVEPYFTVSNLQKWAGVQYPVIYHMQADAVDKKTGKACFVAIKIVYGGGARPIVVIAPDKNSYLQYFPHPNDIDPMLDANRFAVTANDITGTWKGSGGGGVEYYNAYSGTYAGMSAVSSTDEFIFNSNGTYSSTYRSASMNNGGAQFGGQDFKGNFSVTDWSITASNRFAGKTTTYNAQLIAVKNGYLLYMVDAANPSMKYTLFKTK